MPSGFFGKAKITAVNTPTIIGGSVPAGTVMTLNLRITNPTGTNVKVKVYITNAANPVPADDLYTPQATVIPSVPMDETCIVLSAGERLFYEADTLGVIARVAGFGEPA